MKYIKLTVVVVFAIPLIFLAAIMAIPYITLMSGFGHGDAILDLHKMLGQTMQARIKWWVDNDKSQA